MGRRCLIFGNAFIRNTHVDLGIKGFRHSGIPRSLKGVKTDPIFLDRIHRISRIFFVFLPSLMEGRKCNPGYGQGQAL
jgi:hypothetical protein